MSLPRSCRVCGRPGKSLCDADTKLREAARPSAAARGYDGNYTRNRALVVDRAWANGDGCYKCGKRFTGREQITADHIRPLRRGGNSELSNLAPCCASCNFGWQRRTPRRSGTDSFLN